MRTLVMVGFITAITNAATVYSQKHVAPGQLIEEFSFVLKDFKIDHQGETNNLNISISYRYAANITKADYVAEISRARRG